MAFCFDMKIYVKVKTGSKEEKVEKIDESHFVVFVKQKPIRGSANKAVIKALADYFKIKPYNIVIISGLKSRTKTLDIDF
jgi:uncharacterized protein (TIGR00251 family)